MTKHKKLTNSRSLIKYIKDRCKKYSEELLHVGAKNKGYGDKDYTLVLIQNNKLVTFNVYEGSWDIDLYIPKLNEYFETGVWDSNVYYEIYNDGIALTDVHQFPSDKEAGLWLSDYRKNINSAVGMREVARPENFVKFMGNAK